MDGFLRGKIKSVLHLGIPRFLSLVNFNQKFKNAQDSKYFDTF